MTETTQRSSNPYSRPNPCRLEVVALVVVVVIAVGIVDVVVVVVVVIVVLIVVVIVDVDEVGNSDPFTKESPVIEAVRLTE
jgi:hypothetical protein